MISSLKYSNPAIYKMVVLIVMLSSLAGIVGIGHFIIGYFKLEQAALSGYHKVLAIHDAYKSEIVTKSAAYYEGMTEDGLIAIRVSELDEARLYQLADIEPGEIKPLAEFLNRYRGSKLFMDLHYATGPGGHQYITIWNQLPVSLNRQIIQVGLAVPSQHANTFHYNDIASDYHWRLFKHD